MSETKAHLNRAIRATTDHMMLIIAEGNRVDKATVASELFEHLSTFHAMYAHCGIVASREELAEVSVELKTSNSLVVCLLEPPQTLTSLDFPNLNLATLTAGCKHLGILAKAQTQHRVFHHHKVLLCLILEIFANLTGDEVPHLDETIHRTGDQILAIW